MPRPNRKVIIVGAGVAGLSCAQELRASSHPPDVIVLEARNRVGGRILTTWLDAEDPAATALDAADRMQALPQAPQTAQDPVPQHTTPLPRRHSFSDLANGVTTMSRTTPTGVPKAAVDIGASIMHGCGDETQIVFRRAIAAKIRAPVVAGGGFYESTEHALWFNDATGTLISTEKIVEVHNIFFMASRYMAAVASASDDGAADMQTVFDCGVQYVCEQLGGRQLSNLELAILRKICARSVGYCSPMKVMALMQASAGMEQNCADAHIGMNFEEDDPPYPGEVPSMSSVGIRNQASRLNKAIVATQKPPKPMVASKRGGNGDRIVLDGYTPFLIDSLMEGLDVRCEQAVCGVSQAIRAPVNLPATEMQDPNADSPERSTKLFRPTEDRPGETWQGGSPLDTRTIVVSTRTGEVYQGDFVVVSLPLGVLKSNHEESSITFSPPLSGDKMDAIHGMGMGVHNKIILRFREGDVFWPPKLPQLNCLDPRFQFFNLHTYGKPGVLLIHVFAESGFANGYNNLSDPAVVAEVLLVLGGMFCKSSTEAETAGVNETPQTPQPARIGKGRARVSALMNICEKPNCRLPVTPVENGASLTNVHCSSCGHSMLRGTKEEPEEAKSSEKSARLRDKAAREKDAAETVKFRGELEEIELAPGFGNFTWSKLPAPVEYIVTRWDQDPYALGSYSYMPCGSSWQMIDDLAAPEPRNSECPYLFFAGEHCSDLGWQCVHGALETGIRAARDILSLLQATDGAPEGNDIDFADAQHLQSAPVVSNGAEVPIKDIPIPRTSGSRKRRNVRKPVPTNSSPETFWTPERERALTRALVGYSDVYGNLTDVIDEISYAIFTFKKEPTDMSREQVTELVHRRIFERNDENDPEAVAFLNFHSPEKSKPHEEVFPRPFHEVHSRKRLVGLNGSILKDMYADYIITELKKHANAVFQNQISYRETLRKIALMIYKKDGGLMTKRCLSEYLRTQEFGTGPQKELFLEKYLPK